MNLITPTNLKNKTKRELQSSLSVTSEKHLRTSVTLQMEKTKPDKLEANLEQKMFMACFVNFKKLLPARS